MMMNTKISFVTKNLLFAVMVLFTSGQVMAEIVVIVNPKSEVTELSASDIKALYLGKSKQLKAFDQAKGSDIRKTFMNEVVGKTESQFKAYWSKRIFSGKGSPPKMLSSDAAIKSQVAGSDEAIGYIDSGAVDSSVKVVYKLSK
jgi:hypothetical protein